MRTLTWLLVVMIAGCADGDSDADEGAESHGTADGGSSVGDSASTGEQTACDPSDPDIGPAVAVTISNQTDAPLYFTTAESCAFGSAFGISRGDVALRWVLGICESCADAVQGLCQCPGACAQDTVVRIDPGGRYAGEWPGSEIFGATLTGACMNESCVGECSALAQADPGDYTASGVASPMLECDFETCDCLEPPDPDGWCTINGRRTGGDIPASTAFAYPGETAVEIVFD